MTAPDANQGLVLATLYWDHWLYQSQIVERTGLSQGGCEAALAALHARGMVRCNKAGNQWTKRELRSQ